MVVKEHHSEHSSIDKNGGIIISAIEETDPSPKLTGWAGFKDSFRRADFEDLGINMELSEAEKIGILTAKSPLSRSLKSRHLQMISIGGAIGTGLFVGSGGSLRTAGPAGLLIAYLLTGTMMYCTVQSLGELAVTFPVAGSFLTYNSRFIDPSWGFAMAWNYAIGWLVTMPLELIAAAITIKYWNSTINSAALVVIFYVLVVAINLFGVRGYGEAEFFFAIIKVVTILGYIILGIVLVCGGGPKGGYIGGRYWHDPGAFANGFKGVCTVFVNAAFAFGGTELAGLAAAESANPRKSLPKATKQVFWRITLFYIVSLTLVGLLVPYNDKRLFKTSSVDASASPFVISVVNAGIKGLPSVINVVIMISVISVGNSAVFGSSRTLAALAASGQAPSILGYIDKQGRPLVGILVQDVFGLLCFLTASKQSGVVFDWLLAISGLSSLFTWASINFCLIRFRRALYVQGRDTSELSYTTQVGVYGAIYGVLLNILVLIAQFWIALFPLKGKPNASDFFQSYLSFPIVLVFYLGHKVWTKNWTWYIRAKDIDIDTGRRELDLDVLRQEIAEEKELLSTKPFYYRVYRWWC
ncbi:general amino acid permease [Suhomyces tanzawaensis NRRL Y-17324]|uniref:General amino acid permease n=1 Tax=Suhomyces tanzawaensis NRRL Y-17324 TaxID=984487 RepID=A0A1E4SDT6_9ASCO|nr:general amino acid permease [Suhomyces tanzawaensis NRRL Y-17324]ODV77681.1 general amino acid permease [Suhomyces tanzawaensis NRRL Y-17324]